MAAAHYTGTGAFHGGRGAVRDACEVWDERDDCDAEANSPWAPGCWRPGGAAGGRDAESCEALLRIR